MNNIFTITGVALLILFVMQTNYALINHQPEVHEHEKSNTLIAANNEANEHENNIMLSPEQINLGNIQIDTLVAKRQHYQYYAPGEIKANGYQSYLVSPRTDSVVVARHVSLGDNVTKGQVLVTLFSETVAQAQADFIITASNWQRTQQLGRDTVSERDLVAAQSRYQASYAKLIAFGLTPENINAIGNDNNNTLGQYSLIAERDGLVLQDHFMQGQRVEAGESIMVLADENELWVQAYLPPDKPLALNINNAAIIEHNGVTFSAKVIQDSHTIDPITRTRIVRLAVKNNDHRLHSGMFVNVYFQFVTPNKVIAIPEHAFNRNPNGDWTVFVAKNDNQFEAKVVKRGQSFGFLRQALGLASGQRIVTDGSFFIASEIAKGGFDPHNH